MTSHRGADLPRVLSYPPRHAYVDRLHSRVATLVHRDQPWPRLPDFYDPAWVTEHAGDWDVAHLHFTWEQHPVAQVEAVLDAHRDAGVAVVWTAHDLRNPHTTSGEADDGYLRLLADRADAVVTLTPGAADDIARRFHRRAEVIEHGPLAPQRPHRHGPRTGALRVLVHAKSLRTNLDLSAAIRAAERAVATGSDLELTVSVHDEPAVLATVAALRPGRGVHVHAHAPWDAARLATAIAAADVLLLPYRWGTHSGMVELATDLGTAVVAADVGHLAEQGALLTVPVLDEAVDEVALGDLLRRIADDRTLLPPPVPEAARRRALDRFVTAHRALYLGLTT